VRAHFAKLELHAGASADNVQVEFVTVIIIEKGVLILATKEDVAGEQIFDATPSREADSNRGFLSCE
jgi:hypothetical protein